MLLHAVDNERFKLAQNLIHIATVDEWVPIIKGEARFQGTVHCESCKRWLSKDCEGCFIFERTNGRFCEGTPVIWYNQFSLIKYNVPTDCIEYYELMFEMKLAAQAQLDFLNKLYLQVCDERTMRALKKLNVSVTDLLTGDAI